MPGVKIVNKVLNAPAASLSSSGTPGSSSPKATGPLVTVALIDSGVEIANKVLAGSIWSGGEPCGDVDTDRDGLVGDCHGWNFVTGQPDVSADAVVGGDLHGTRIAGAILTAASSAAIEAASHAAAAANRPAAKAVATPRVRLLPYIVGTDAALSLDLAARAIYLAIDHGARIIVLAFAGPGSPSSPAARALLAAMNEASKRGVMVVTAAGNDGQDNDQTDVLPANLHTASSLTVGATASDGTYALWSNTGALRVDLFAPGSGIASTGIGGAAELLNGTSVAAAVVAGELARLVAQSPSSSSKVLHDRLLALTILSEQMRTRSMSGGALLLAAPAAEATGYASPSAGSPGKPNSTAPSSPTPSPSDSWFAEVPPSAGPVPLSSSTPHPAPPLGLATRVKATPIYQVYAVDPLWGPTGGGTQLTLWGAKLPAGPTVLVGGNLATIVDVGTGFVTVLVPYGSGKVELAVGGAAGVDILPVQYDYR